MRRAITATRSSRFEYELEAEATHWLTKNGAQAAYPAIVASGPNGNAWHYEDNGRRFQPGDLVVMDYGGSLDWLHLVKITEHVSVGWGPLLLAGAVFGLANVFLKPLLTFIAIPLIILTFGLAYFFVNVGILAFTEWVPDWNAPE